MQDDPPVADFVAAALDGQLPVGGEGAGRLPLLGEVREQIALRVVVEAGLAQPLLGRAGLRRRDLPRELPERLAQLGGAADAVAVPERHLARRPNAGTTLTRSWVISTMRQLVVPSVKTSLTRDS
nr:hypothetical protein GCM10025699_04580 [Microbacterium flavescens]